MLESENGMVGGWEEQLKEGIVEEETDGVTSYKWRNIVLTQKARRTARANLNVSGRREGAAARVEILTGLKNFLKQRMKSDAELGKVWSRSEQYRKQQATKS